MQTVIIVPLDGSALAEGVLPQAKLLARANGSTLVLLRVTAPPLMTESLVSSLPAPVIVHPTQQQDAEIAQQYLEQTARRLDAEGFTVRALVLEGDPAAAIVLFAREEPDVSLIAMATHGRSGVNRWLFGSVAEKVLQAAPVPLLLVRPCPAAPVAPHPHSYKTILVPVDGSVFAEQALDQASDLAHATGAALLLVSVVPGLEDSAAEATGAVPVWELEHHEAQVGQAARYLRHTAVRILNAGIPVETQIVKGRPAEAILEAAREGEADLVVMATHGRTGVQRLWLGSVAARVMQAATLPVLLVRAHDPAVPVPDEDEAFALAR